VDEQSKLYIKSDWDANYWTMYSLRDEAVKSGASVGFYSLDDFTGDVAPRCKVYVFANAFRLTDWQIRAIRSRLDREEATAIWIYAPGYIGPEGADITRACRLTGIKLSVRDGRQGSEGVGLLKGESWGPELPLSPRLFVADEKAEALGRYKSDGSISAAQTRNGHHRSIFLGDMGVTSRMLKWLFQSSGVHIWAKDAGVIQTDGDVLMIHSDKAGLKPIHLPPGIEAEPIKGEIEWQEGNAIFVRFQPGDTLWLRLTQKEPG